MNGTMQPIMIDGYYCVCSWGSILSCGSKTSRVDNKGRTEPVTDGVVGVAVDDAMCLREVGKHPLFNSVTGAIGTVAYTEQVTTDSDPLHFRQGQAGLLVAHIAVDRMDLLTPENVENGGVCKIAGMDYHAAITESFCNILLERLIFRCDMCV